MKGWAIGLVVLFGLGCGLVSLAADFDGDGTNDIGIFRDGLWAIREVTHVYFGMVPGDDPVPGDYDGDGTVDIAIFRDGLWAIRGATQVWYGTVPGDEPLIGIGGKGYWYKSGDDLSYWEGNVSIGGGHNVGIGTNSPEYDLDILKLEQPPIIRLQQRFEGDPDAQAVFGVQSDSGGAFIGSYSAHDLIFRTGNEEKARITEAGLIKMKNQLAMKASLIPPLFADPNYASVVSWRVLPTDAAELWAGDGSGNLTILSPHDQETGDWIFLSRNVKTGREVRVNMEKLVHLVEELSGEKLLEEKWN